MNSVQVEMVADEEFEGSLIDTSIEEIEAREESFITICSTDF